MKKLIFIIAILIVGYKAHSQSTISVNNVIKTLKTSFVEGVDSDSLIIDFDNILYGELKHAVVKINSLNDLVITDIPNSKSFINNDFKTLVCYYPSEKNPLAKENKDALPYKFSGKWGEDTFKTIQTPIIEDSKSFYFNVILYITPFNKKYVDTISYSYSIKFGNRKCNMLVKAIVHYENVASDLSWIEDNAFRVKFTHDFNDFSLIKLPPRVYTNDYNNDGYLDSLIVRVNARGYPKTYKDGVEFVSGISKNHFYLRRSSYFDDKEGSFSSFDKIDDELCTENNRPIREIMRDSAFSSKDKEIEPVFEYYINMEHQISKIQESTNTQVDSPFYETIKIKLNWYPLPMKLPKSQYTWFEFDSTNTFDSHQAGDKGWLFYYASFHLNSLIMCDRIEDMNEDEGKIKDFKFVAQNKTYKIYRTHHGVVAQKGDKYAWVLHGYGSLRLRHASVCKVWLHGNYVIAEVMTLGWITHYVMVDLKTGKQSRFYGIFEPDNPKYMKKLIKSFKK